MERAEGDRKMCIHEIYQGRVKKALAELGGKAMIFELLDSLNKDEINFMEGSVELDEVSSEPDLTQA